MNARTILNVAAALAACISISVASAAPPVPSAEAKAQIAPGGMLRVAILNASNYRTPGSTEADPRGMAVDLGKALAASVGATFVPVFYTPIAEVIRDAGTGKWDVAFLGLEESRRAFMDFTAPYMQSENTYMVPAGSALMTVRDVDREGVRIGVAKRSVQEVSLTAELKKAKLVGADSNSPALDMLKAGNVEAVAAGRGYLAGLLAQMPGYRLVEGNYQPSPIAMAVPKGRPAAAAYANEFIRHAKESGLVKGSLDAAKLVGVSIPR